MNQIELSNLHRQHPKAGDSWSNWTKQKPICFVLDVLKSGNVVLTDQVHHEWDGKVFCLNPAREVSFGEYSRLVGGNDVHVTVHAEHYLLDMWKAGGSRYIKAVDTHIDLKITGRYIHALQGRGFEPVQNVSGSYSDGDHLLWMLFQIHHNELSSQTEAHRWLGFVQCALCVLKIIDLNEERDFTRDLFNGA